MSGSSVWTVRDRTVQADPTRTAGGSDNVRCFTPTWGRAGPTPNRPPRGLSIDVFMTYENDWVDAQFAPTAASLMISSGPLTGQVFRSPSGAAKAVIRHTNPASEGSRNGWITWFVASTGEPFQSDRHRL